MATLKLPVAFHSCSTQFVSVCSVCMEGEAQILSAFLFSRCLCLRTLCCFAFLELLAPTFLSSLHVGVSTTSYLILAAIFRVFRLEASCKMVEIVFESVSSPIMVGFKLLSDVHNIICDVKVSWCPRLLMFGHIAFCYACYFRALKTPLLQPFSVEDIAASFADSTRSVVGHAQTSLETAQRNWSSLLVGTSKWADDAGFALRGATTSTRLENTFGDLWNDAMPSFNKSRVCVDRLS
jgi:hypothetical protein